MLSAATQDGGFISTLDYSLEGISEKYIRYTASLILYLTSGHRVHSADDKCVRFSETAVMGVSKSGNPASHIVDIFPIRESSLFFFVEFVLFWNLNLFLLSKIYTDMASRDGLQTTRPQGLQRC